jgi:acyl-CoA thioesterase-2
MPASASELLDLLDLEQLEVDLFRGRQPDTAMQRVFGGQVAAQALRASAATVEPAYRLHSLHSYFLLPGDPAVPIVYDVERIRDGRSFATRRAVARQHGRAIYYITASFHVEEPGFDHQTSMPNVPEPDDCPRLGDLFTTVDARRQDLDWEREWSALDVRYAGDSRPGGSLVSDVQPARTQIWFRVAGSVPDDRVVNECLLTYASDLTLLGVTLVPHGVLIWSPQIQPASLDHSMWFHRPFRADQWLLYDQRSPSASGGTGFAVGSVYAQDGRLIASVAQEGLIRPVDPGRANGA